MPKHTFRRKNRNKSKRGKSQRRGRTRRHKMRGGYSSASSYAEHVVGSANSQFARTMDQSGAHQGNELIGAQGQGIVNSSQLPSSSQLGLIQSAGKRRKRGGFLGQVISQAIVPFGILGMQQRYGRNRGSRSHSRTHSRR